MGLLLIGIISVGALISGSIGLASYQTHRESKRNLREILSKIIEEDFTAKIKNDSYNDDYETFHLSITDREDIIYLSIYERIDSSENEKVINITYDKATGSYHRYLVNPKYMDHDDAILEDLDNLLSKSKSFKKKTEKVYFFHDSLKEAQKIIDGKKQWLFDNEDLLTQEEKHLIHRQENDFNQLMDIYSRLHEENRQVQVEKLKEAQTIIHETIHELMEKKEAYLLSKIDRQIELIRKRN